jgi:hydrogen peroxide-dependent heme synthase
MSKPRTESPSGWPVLHMYYRIERAPWRALSASERNAAVEEFQGLLSRCVAEEGLQLIPIAGVAKSDFAVMAVHPDLSRVQQIGQEVAATALGACLTPVYNFLSISEASEYISTSGDWARQLIDEQGMDPSGAEFAASIAGFQKRMDAYRDMRVHPQLPSDFPVLCFYPMRKSRTDARNWYSLDFGERKRYMAGHANAGRRYADRITQLITSATGIDDWEWGVTLFSRDLKSIRDIVYEMRFDPGSAIYGEFGPFYIGVRFKPEDLAAVLRL